ncbi:esterase-like activity of phytase family protein [Nocardia sp. XZ_19_385]|uniref:esterase-like activity of phytase family protein n=1 Tax=Nocardia sp. XZ_19_385 TaxID=2769488 RepID=UPI0018900B21|nr:esterase-like activity of phytase family protein [Nocardia sp. XZ_19_385]
MRSRGPLLLILACALTAALAPSATAAPPVRLLGERVVPFAFDFRGTTVGGLSGIDALPQAGEYVLISDDRSALQSARFYTARIAVDGNGVGPIEFTGTRPLCGADGAPYPQNTVDPEEIRVDPWTGNYFWTQEGERAAGVLLDPSVRVTRPDGAFDSELPIPDNERMRPDSGPQRNGALEAATFAAGGTLFVTALEAPLMQDGPMPAATTGATTRITVQARTGQLLAQYAYPLDPVFTEGTGSNGITAILAVDPLDPAKYLVVERSFVEGAGNRIRIYEADLGAATNVLNAPLTNARPVAKRLLADLSELGLSTVDNIEGITWGPRLPSGERTLLLVSDDNFNDKQVTQFIALALR